VEYRLSENDRESIQAAGREVFLGLILASGDLRIRIADAVQYPGHTDWVQRDEISQSQVKGGFSFIVKAGLVTGFFPSSQLNNEPDWRLPVAECEAILTLLPVSPDLKVF
jgi:hypothetical protein